MNRRNSSIAGAIILLLICAAWALGWFHRSDPYGELRALAGKAFDRDLSDAERNQYRDQLRQQLEGMTPDQRRAFFESGRPQFEKRMQQRMDAFFAMSPQDQKKQLDQDLDRMMKNNQGQGQGQNRNRGGGNRSSSTADQRAERAKRRLDGTSPKMRAQFAEYRRQLDQRAQQRGMNPSTLPGWGGPGGGGGRRG